MNANLYIKVSGSGRANKVMRKSNSTAVCLPAYLLFYFKDAYGLLSMLYTITAVGQIFVRPLYTISSIQIILNSADNRFYLTLSM